MNTTFHNEAFENDEVYVDEIDYEEMENYDADSDENNSGETKDQKFVRIAEIRVNKMVDWIRKIDNLSNRINYEYTDEQVEEIFNYIQSELDEAKKHFLSSGKKETKKFKFGQI